MTHQLRILKINLSILTTTTKKKKKKKKKHMNLDLTPFSSRTQKNTNPKKSYKPKK